MTRTDDYGNPVRKGAAVGHGPAPRVAPPASGILYARIQELEQRVEALRGLILRLDWTNIHTHYGLTTSCADCQIYLTLESEV
jgi:hypothetical protein